VGLAGLANIGILEGTRTYSVEDVAVGLQNFIICIEMFIFAWLHDRYFNYAEFAQFEKSVAEGAPTETDQPALKPVAADDVSHPPVSPISPSAMKVTSMESFRRKKSKKNQAS